MDRPLHALIVEDSIDDTYFIVRELERGGFHVAFERVDTAAALRAALERRHWDVILCDYALPRFNGDAALALFQEMQFDIPFIIVSGAIGEERVAEILKAGAHDCVLKNNLARLVPAVTRELRAAEQRRILRQTEFRSQFLASLVESSDDSIIGTTLDGTIISWNAGAEKLYGHRTKDAIGRSISLLFPPHRPEELPEILKQIRNGATVPPYETIRRRKDGTTVEVAVSVSPIKDHAGRVIGASSIARDITHLKREENERLELIRDLTDALDRMPPPEPKAGNEIVNPQP